MQEVGMVRDKPVPTGAAAVHASGLGLVRPAGRDTQTVLFEQEVVSFFVDAAGMIGVPRSVAAIYGICFASATPVSFADIAVRLDISQGSISQGLRMLRDVGALKVVGQHERREYFAPEMQLRRLAERYIEERLEKQLVAGGERLKAMRSALQERKGPEMPELVTRLKYLQSWQNKGRALIPLVRAGLKLA